MKIMSDAPRRWLRSGLRSDSLRAAWHYLPIAIVLFVWQLVVEFDVVDRAFLPSYWRNAARLVGNDPQRRDRFQSPRFGLSRVLGACGRFDPRRGDWVGDGNLAPGR